MASTCRILAVSGSLQARSANRTLLDLARASTPEDEDVDVVVFDGLRTLPSFDPDVGDDQTPETVLAWRRELAASDAVLFASPEYGFSLPGVLKNAIDWVIGSGELEGKVVGLTAAVKMRGRGLRGLGALAEPLRAVIARIVGGSSIVQGPSFEGDVAELVRAIVREVRQPSVPPDHGMGRPRPSALVLEWVERLNRRDADALALLYAKDARVEPVAGAPAVGRAAIRGLYEQRFATATTTLIAESLFDDGSSALLEWRDASEASEASERRGCVSFSVKRWEIASQRDYAGPSSPERRVVLIPTKPGPGP